MSAFAGLRTAATARNYVTPSTLLSSVQPVRTSILQNTGIRSSLVRVQHFSQGCAPRQHQATSSKAPTTELSDGEALKLLNEQRSLRPNSPHLTVYQPQLTWVLSGLTRMTGVAASGLFYIWALSYLAVPYVGSGQILSTAHVVQYAALAPVWLKLAIKIPLAAAVSFHSLNGLRHLAWDIGYGLSMKGVYRGGYIVLGATVLSTIGLCSL